MNIQFLLNRMMGKILCIYPEAKFLFCDRFFQDFEMGETVGNE